MFHFKFAYFVFVFQKKQIMAGFLKYFCFLLDNIVQTKMKYHFSFKYLYLNIIPTVY